MCAPHSMSTVIICLLFQHVCKSSMTRNFIHLCAVCYLLHNNTSVLTYAIWYLHINISFVLRRQCIPLNQTKQQPRAVHIAIGISTYMLASGLMQCEWKTMRLRVGTHKPLLQQYIQPFQKSTKLFCDSAYAQILLFIYTMQYSSAVDISLDLSGNRKILYVQFIWPISTSYMYITSILYSYSIVILCKRAVCDGSDLLIYCAVVEFNYILMG